jgi:MFS family permease
VIEATEKSGDVGKSLGKSKKQFLTRHATLSLLVGIFSINFMDRQILAILVQPIKAELGLTDTQVGLLYGLAFALLFAAAGIPIARYADRGYRARTVNCALIAFSLMSAACGLASSYWQLLLARTGVAIGGPAQIRLRNP